MTTDEATPRDAAEPEVPGELDPPDDVAAPDDVDAEFAEVRSRLDELPWWRRPRRLRRQLSRTLVFVSLLSVLLVGGLNFFAARDLLDQGTEDQLVATGESRARSIEGGVERTLDQTSAAAADLAVITALEDFEEAFPDAGELSAGEEDELDAYYDEFVVGPLAENDIAEVTADEAQPASESGRYLQYHYIVEPGLPPEERITIDDPGDGSDYSEVHARYHPYLAALVETLDVDDLMLISAPSGDIVYTAEKRIDFGVNITEGVYSRGELAETVLDKLPRVRTGDSVFADFQIYIPAGGDAVAFVAAAVRRDTELLGVLVLEISVDQLSAITTANGRWEEVGLGEGESYVVGADELLRSESRLWIEDPEAYLDEVDPELADRIVLFGSPVNLQPVETEPVAVALDGDRFEGTSENYLGTRTLAFSTAIDVPGVDWVVVAEVPLDDARSPLYSYALRMLLVVAIIVPLAAVIGAWLANRSTRPVAPVVDAATAVAKGDRDPDLPDLGKDEFGDLGRRLKAMASDLGAQETALAEEFDERRKLLMSVLPPRLVGSEGVVSDTGARAQLATAISVNVLVGGRQTDADTVDEILSRVAALVDEAAVDHDVDRVRVAADRSLYIAGIDVDNEGVDDALEFVADARRRVAAFAEHDAVDASIDAGVSTGPVGVGVLQRGSVTFGAWGEPVRRALAIGSLAQADQVLVDASTAAEADRGRFALSPATEVIALDGETMGLHRLDDAATDGARST